MNASISRAAERLQAAAAEAARGLIERETIVELMILGAVAGEHILIIGPPGTAKSAAARRTSERLGGSYFEYLLGRFTEPNEIFGPIDLNQLQQGRVQTQTAGMLPEADVAFLDEIFRGSTAILNTLLAVLNERVYRRGHTIVRCPLRVCVAAANSLPTDPALAAFADRFLLTHFVEATADHRLEDLLRSGWSVDADVPLRGEELPAVDALRNAIPSVNLDGVRGPLADAIRTLRGSGISLTDRRVVRMQRLCAAAALLDGRNVADPRDLWPIIYAIQNQGQQSTAQTLLRNLLEASENASLQHAAEQATWSPAARAARLVERATKLFATSFETEDAKRASIESVLREIDAAFLPDELPPALAEARAKLAAVIP